MQTAGMLRGTRAIYSLVLLASLVIDHAHSYPYQLLPSIPGYIPVYIRNGDQPLEEINPALAEAFHEHSSLSKSIRLDRNLGHLDSIEESRTNSVIDGSSKRYYPAYAREPETTVAKEESHVENGPGHQVPKLISLYELHEKLKKNTESNEEPRTSTDSKESPAKMTPISSTEKENLDKDETKPNDLYDRNPNYPELPADIGHNRDTSQDFVSVIGLDAFTERPNVRQYKDLSHLTDERNAVDDKNEKTEEAAEDEPVKVQRPSDILSNVQKLSPIAPPEAYATEKSEVKSETEKKKSEIENASVEQPAVLYYKDLSHLSGNQKVIESSDKKGEEPKKEENSSDPAEVTVLKETTKENPPSNVLKLSPIAPPEAYESQEKSTKDKIKEEKPIETSLVHEPIQQPAVRLYKDLSHLSADEGETKEKKTLTSSPAAKEENETPIKVESPLNVPANVVKLSPIAPPEAYSKEDKSVAPSTVLMAGIVQDDEKKDRS